MRDYNISVIIFFKYISEILSFLTLPRLCGQISEMQTLILKKIYQRIFRLRVLPKSIYIKYIISIFNTSKIDVNIFVLIGNVGTNTSKRFCPPDNGGRKCDFSVRLK